MFDTLGTVSEISRFKKTFHVKVASESVGPVNVIVRKGTVSSSLLQQGKKVLVKGITAGNMGLVGQTIRSVKNSQKKQNPIKLVPSLEVHFR